MDRNAARTAFLATWAPRRLRRPGRPERELARQDPALAPLLRAVARGGGAVRPPRPGRHEPFDFLVRAVLYQQLSKAAAATLYARLLGAVGGPPTPSALAGRPPAWFRGLGVSGAKGAALSALADAVASGRLRLGALRGLPDEAVRAALCAQPGIGPWTADMFLLFHLGRRRVLPWGDLGVRAVAAALHGPLSDAALRARVAERWAPHESVAALACWAALDAGWRPGG